MNIKLTNKLFTLTVLVCMSNLMLNAQDQHQPQKRTNIALEHGSHRLGKRTDQAMQDWRDYGFGQFIHWGVYAIPGGHWNGEFYSGAAEWIRTWKHMDKEAYDQLYKKFDPHNFDAKAWAKSAKNMGAKYLIITTKHHDGFCLWPSQYTDYTIANSPYQKDIIKDFVDAYTAEGIDVYLYFSIIDWSHPGYRSKIENEEDQKQYEIFKSFTRNQLIELVDRYPKTKGLWFDGTWDSAWKEQAEYADLLGSELRAKIPGLIIGSRFRPDELGNRHFDANGNMMGDYEQGWERKMPNSIEDVHGNDWDAVMTIPENQWGYHSDWRGYVKSSYELIEMMVKAVSLDGNFVLNFGPKPDGAMREEEALISNEIAQWMKQNSTVIYQSTYAGLDKQDWGYYTKKLTENKIHMVVFNKPIDNKYRVDLNKGMKIKRAYLLEDSKSRLPIEHYEKNSYVISAKSKQKDQAFVIVLEID